MAGIDDLIAQGPGRRDLSPLGEMFGAYRQGVQAKREDEFAAGRQGLGAFVGPDGRLDYRAAGLHLLRAGDVNGAIALARIAAATGRRGPSAPGWTQGGAGASDRPFFVSGAGGELMPPGAEPHESKPGMSAVLPRLTTREQVQSVIQAAWAAIAAGKDPGLVMKRLRDLGIDASWF